MRYLKQRSMLGRFYVNHVKSEFEMPTILILEDDDDLRNLYSRALNFKGYEVTVADRAEAALEILGHCKPDLAVLDMSMPGLPGSAVVEHMLTNTSDVPIIIISCDERFRYKYKAEDLKFMAKPINLADLYQAVAQAV